MKICVVGATGVVGRKFIEILQKSNIKSSDIELFASKRSLGTQIYYKDKYLTKSKVKREDREIPAQIPSRLATKIRKLTYKLYEQFDLSGVVRVDFIYKEETEDLYVNEVNTIPGMTSASLVPKMVATAGLDMTDWLSTIIENS